MLRQFGPNPPPKVATSTAIAHVIHTRLWKRRHHATDTSKKRGRIDLDLTSQNPAFWIDSGWMDGGGTGGKRRLLTPQ
jgi:hypothetical protein